jgi:uncharacterized membrane protein YqjE
MLGIAVVMRSGIWCKEDGWQANTVALVYLLPVTNAIMGIAMGLEENKAENLQWLTSFLCYNLSFLKFSIISFLSLLLVMFQGNYVSLCEIHIFSN